MIDALIVGYNDPDFSSYVVGVRGMGARSGAFQDLDLAFVEHDGRPYRALDLVTKFHHADGGGALRPFHNCDFLWPTITYLGSYLARHGLSFDYVNHFQLEKAALREKLLRQDIRTVAITTTLYVTPQPIIEIIDFIRRHNISARIVVGGPFVANQVATRDAGMVQGLFELLGADFYVDSNEGEASYVRLLRALRAGSTFDDIDNIAYRSNGRYVQTARTAEANSLAETPIDYGLFAAGAVGEFVSLRTAKSCPFSCAFCGFPKRAGAYTYLPLDSVERELDTLAALGTVTTLTFLDDTFNVPKGRFKNILRMMIRKKYPFKWNSFYRADHGDEEAVALMAESGCEGVFLGVESGSDVMLKHMNKTARRKHYEKAIPLLQQHGISSYASLIVGYPGETEATVQETIDLIEGAKPDYFRAQLWYADPLTPIWERRDEFGIRGEAFNWWHNTMDSETACDHIDRMLLSVRNSTWMPQNGFEQWSTFYLQRRGMSRQQVKSFIVAFNDGVKEKVLWPERREMSPRTAARIRRLCQWNGSGESSQRPEIDSAYAPAAYRAAETFFVSKVCPGLEQSKLSALVAPGASRTGPEACVDLGVATAAVPELLAAFAVLLSRIDGQEDALIVADELPIRLRPKAGASFRDLVRDVTALLEEAAPHARYGIHFVANAPRLRRHGLAPPALDVGFRVNGETLPVQPVLVLDLRGRPGAYALGLRYLPNCLAADAVEMIGSYFLALWADLSRAPARAIGDAAPANPAASRTLETVEADFSF
jgi:anaerobic magnesium-protoporphyrin IX monomethyl ester cyclase